MPDICPKCSTAMPKALPQVNWQFLCEDALVGVGGVLGVCGRHVAASAMIELLRQVPMNRDALQAQALDENTLLGRCLKEALESNGWRRDEFQRCLPRLAAISDLDAETRAIVQACVIGALLGLAMA